MCCMNLSLKYNNESSYRKDTEIYEYMLSFYPITTITPRDFRTFEMDLASIIEWDFTKPTVYTFLQYFINLPSTNTHATPTDTGAKGQNYDNSSTNIYLIKTNFNNIIYCLSEYAILIKSLSHVSPSLVAAACYLMTCEIYHRSTTPITTPTSTTYTSACPVYNGKYMYVYTILSYYTIHLHCYYIHTSYNTTHTHSVYSIILLLIHIILHTVYI